MKKGNITKSEKAKTPASIFSEALGEFKYPKVELINIDFKKAEEDGEGLFKLETIHKSIFPDESSEIFPEDPKKEVLRFLDEIGSHVKSDYTEEELKRIFATEVIGPLPPRLAMAIGDTALNTSKGSKQRELAEKDYTLAYGLKISLLKNKLEEALEKRDVYRACYCCINICWAWNQMQMLPLSEPVRQMNYRNKFLRLKKKKIPATDTDAQRIIDFYNKEKKTFEEQYKTSHGSSKHALASTCEEFNLGQTSIKKVFKAYKKKTLTASN